MQVSRREFLKLTGTGLCASLGTALPATTVGAAGRDLTGDGLGILYDPTKCIGCRACQAGCKEWNGLPAETTDAAGIYESPGSLSAVTWTLIKLQQAREPDWHFFNYQCMHCIDAACVTVCPSGALFKDERGFTAYDRNKCIGCGYCTQYCPYDVPHLTVESTVTGAARASKCTFCQDRVWGELGGPSCAEACPTDALVWGRRTQLLDSAKARVAQLSDQGRTGAQLYGETQSGGLARLSILLDEPAAYLLPADPGEPVLAKVWRTGLVWLAGLASAATVLGVFGTWLVSRRAVQMEEVE
jgi:formate dehydrogenase iron-sulfur subunit